MIFKLDLMGGFYIRKNKDHYEILQANPIDNQIVIKILKILQNKFPQVNPNIYDDQYWYVNHIDDAIQIEINLTGYEPT